MLDFVKLYGSTLADGSLTVTADIKTTGYLFEVEWIDGTFDDGVDAVLSVVRDNDAADVTLLTLTNANNDAIYRVRLPIHDTSGAAISGGSSVPIINGKLKLVVSSGGNVKTGGCIVSIDNGV